jgi:hypothetical protein
MRLSWVTHTPCLGETKYSCPLYTPWSGGIQVAAFILNLGTGGESVVSCMTGLLYSPGRMPCNQCIGGLLGTNGEERNLLSLPGIEAKFIGHAAYIVVTKLPQLAETKCIWYESWDADDKVISEWFLCKHVCSIWTLLYLFCCTKVYLLNAFTAILAERLFLTISFVAQSNTPYPKSDPDAPEWFLYNFPKLCLSKKTLSTVHF